jgi:hypothetical protein
MSMGTGTGTKAERIHYIDNLRWITISLLVLYHACMSYNTWGEQNYIFFKDELLRWLESGRTNQVSLTFEEENAARMASHKRKPSHPSFK